MSAVNKSNLRFVFAVLLSLGCLTNAHSQTSGCKDPAATNYNPAATVNDGSCTYSTTLYTPPLKVSTLDPVLNETSGLQMAGNFLWSFNDGGNPAAIYRIDTLSNTVLQTVNLGGATNVDWEDMAFDGTHFYVGDFGNNDSGSRTDLKIYRFPLSAIPTDYATNPTVTIPSAEIAVLAFRYSDQGTPVAVAANSTKWDCEAMIVEDGKIHLFTKNWAENNTTHYVIDGTAAGTYTATPLETLTTAYLVTGADKVPGANVVVLLGYQASGFAAHFLHLLSDFNGGFFFNGNKRKIDLPNVFTMGQAEGICFRSATYGYISNERFNNVITVEPKLRSFNTTALTPAYVLPLKLLQFSAQAQGGTNLIHWAFSEPVQQADILYSSNRTDFVPLQTYQNTKAGSVSRQPDGAGECYKLRWKNANDGYQYSSTICLNSEGKGRLDKIVLRNSGRFGFDSPTAGQWSFTFLSTDGKLLMPPVSVKVAAGTNTVQLPRTFSPATLVIVKAVRDTEHVSLLLSTVE